MLVNMFTEQHNFKLFFVESICDDPSIIEANILVCSFLNQLVQKLIIDSIIYMLNLLDGSDNSMTRYFKGH